MTVIPTMTQKVRNILELPHGLPWTIQGFGMLRLYLDRDEVQRLHIWDTDQMSVEEVSTVHDHPWDLDSLIVSGTLRNQRYVRAIGPAVQLVESVRLPADAGGEKWMAQPIRTGEGGHTTEPAYEQYLARRPLETYQPGDVYHQDAEEIHESLPSRGCVTVVTRTFSRERDLATSFYKNTSEWVSAEPRPATLDEIQHFTTLALANWDIA